MILSSTDFITRSTYFIERLEHRIRRGVEHFLRHAAKLGTFAVIKVRSKDIEFIGNKINEPAKYTLGGGVPVCSPDRTSSRDVHVSENATMGSRAISVQIFTRR